GCYNKLLWGALETSATKAKVAWSVASLPKTEGGIGIKDRSSWNLASIARHIWNLMICSAFFG
ncbi:hypothetical protein LINPERHAP1_LOCUS5849, partial [Linum perenne]